MTAEKDKIENEKKLAATAAALLVEDGMTVGLGTGSTVAYLLPALAGRGLRIRCVATSPATARAAEALGLAVELFDKIEKLDIAIDGADQISPESWLIKGGGGAQTREKIVASSAEKFVVIASSDKRVDALHAPVPLELSQFGSAATLARLRNAKLRSVPITPDNGLIADYFESTFDPTALASKLSETPGVIDHGLFPPSLVALVLVGNGDKVDSTIPG